MHIDTSVSQDAHKRMLSRIDTSKARDVNMGVEKLELRALENRGARLHELTAMKAEHDAHTTLLCPHPHCAHHVRGNRHRLGDVAASLTEITHQVNDLVAWRVT